MIGKISWQPRWLTVQSLKICGQPGSLGNWPFIPSFTAISTRFPTLSRPQRTTHVMTYFRSLEVVGCTKSSIMFPNLRQIRYFQLLLLVMLLFRRCMSTDSNGGLCLALGFYRFDSCWDTPLLLMRDYDLRHFQSLCLPAYDPDTSGPHARSIIFKGEYAWNIASPAG